MMGHVGAILCVMLLVTGCASSAATNPATTPPPGLATAASPTVPPASEPSPIAVSARVTFDGKDCVYSGPRLIPSPAVLTVTYVPTPAREGSVQFVVALLHGTTQAAFESVNADPSLGMGPGTVAPSFALESSWHAQQGGGTNAYSLQVWRMDDGRVFDEYQIGCITALPGRPASGGAILQLIDSAASPAPSPVS